MKKENFVYDRTLREIFQTVPKGIIKLLTGEEAKQADIIVRLNSGDIFHLEIQLRDDKTISQKVKLPIEEVKKLKNTH